MGFCLLPSAFCLLTALCATSVQAEEVERATLINCCGENGCREMTDEDCFELLNREDMAKWAKERKPGPAKSIDFSYENQEALLVPRQDGIIVNAYVESCDIPVNVEGVGHVAYCKIFIEGDDSPDYMLWPIFSTMPERVLFQLYHDPVEGKHFELRISRFYEELGESITAAMMIRGER